MFQNAYQGGPHVEIYDAKVNKDKEKSYAQLYRMTTPQGFSKIFDKEIKGYIFNIDGHSTKMRLPKDDRVDLCIVQNFLVFQIFLPFGSPWSLEIGIADTQKVNRRINLVSALNKIETKYFHVKAPNDIIKKGVWMNLSIDVNSFMEAWKGSTFRSIDSITIGSACKLRRVYSMKAPIFEINSDDDGDYEEQMQLQQSYYLNQKPEEAPRSFSFPPGFPFINQLITYRKILDNVDPKYLDISTGNVESQETTKYGVGGTQGKLGTAGKSMIKTGLSKGLSIVKRIQSPPKIVGKHERTNITQDFKEKSMIGLKMRDNSQNTYSKRQSDRSPLVQDNRITSSQQYKYNPYTGQRETSPISNSRFSDDERQDECISHKNNSKDPKKQLNSKGIEGIVQKNSYEGYQQNPNQQLSLSLNQVAVHSGFDSSKNSYPKGEDKYRVSQSTKSYQTVKVNPWHSSTNSQGTTKNRVFPIQSEFQDNLEEEIDENIEAEYYDDYDELQIHSANKKDNSVSKEGFMNNVSKYQQQDGKKNTEINPSLEQQRRATKSANNFGPKHDSSLASSNQPHKIKKKPEKKTEPVDQLSQSHNTTDLDEESYFQLTQKFNTVSDPNQFRDIFAPQKSQIDYSQKKQIKPTSPYSNSSREIEEDIEEELQNNNSPSINRQRKQFNQKQNKREFEDSLEKPSPKVESQKKQISSEFKENYINESPISTSKGVNPNLNIYENHLNKFLTQSNRPFTPPFQSVNSGNNPTTLKNNNMSQSQSRGPVGVSDSQHSSPQFQAKKQREPEQIKQKLANESDSLEVIYDKELNCYYDPTTKQYYELKA